jgi:hypothetical protein
MARRTLLQLVNTTMRRCTGWAEYSLIGMWGTECISPFADRMALRITSRPEIYAPRP